MLKNFHLQLYISLFLVGIIFSYAEITVLYDQAPPAQSRNSIQLDMWMPLPSYELVINGDSRTIFATNKINDLKLYLDFSSPIINSTQQILSALRVDSGYFVPLRSRIRKNNRRFAFKLRDILSTAIIKVELEAASLFGLKGLPVSDVAPIIFLYDTAEPGVSLSTSSLNVTKEHNINIVVEFTKPVFEFEALKADVKGGYITRFEEHSKALYTFTVNADSEDLTVYIPAGKIKDISENKNSASNVLHIKHYSAPSLSVGIYLFMTVGILATSIAAVIIFISSANLEATATKNSEGTSFTNPSMNLQGLFGHLQIFVLANWILDPLPNEYLETTKGLRWLIPRGKLPWKNKNSSIWPSNFQSMKFTKMIIRKSVHLTNVTMRNTPFGQPLDSSEYMTYFLRGEPLSASTNIKKMERYTGWEDLEMDLFWLGVGVFSLLAIRLLAFIFIRWRAQKSFHGVFSFPRFELFLLILMLPCISQSSAFVIRGGTSVGLLTGILLLVIPAGTILSVFIFLVISIFSGSLVQYKEVFCENENDFWGKRIWFLFFGKPSKGNWVSKGVPSSFISRFGILFETRKGPPMFVSEEKIFSISSEYIHEENNKIPTLTRLLGYARSSYIIFDLIRRVSFGIISGAFSSGGFKQTLFALIITLIQFLYLIILKPYISRVVNLVEGVSLLCEAALFILAISVNKSNLVGKSNIGYAMVGLLFIIYVCQILNVWCGMIKLLLRLSNSEKISFKLGLKNVAVSATVVPVISPGFSPQQYNIITEKREIKGVKLEKQKSEMKKLRQLAKASFAGGYNYEEGSTSYAV